MPRIYNPNVSTPEQELRALAETEKTVLAIRDMLRRLDLPITAFEAVSNMFINSVSAVMHSDDHAHHVERQKKVAELRRLRAPIIEKDDKGRLVAVRSRIPIAKMGIPSAAGYGPVGTIGDMDDDYFEMSQLSDEDLDAELERARGK